VHQPRQSTPPSRVPGIDPQDCAWVIDAAPAAALHALEAADSSRMTDHLGVCPSCAAEVAGLSSAVQFLGVAADQHEPPETVKANLMALIAPLTEARASPVVLPAVPEVTAAAASNTPIRRRGLTSRIAAVSLLAATLVLGLWMISVQRDLDARGDEIDRLTGENEALALHLDSIQAGRQLLGNSGVWYPLARVNTMSADAGGIMLSAQQGTTTLLSVWNMPEEHDRYHVICESRLGELLSAGEIKVNDRGNGYATLTLPEPVSEYRAVHVIPNGQFDLSDDAFLSDILQLLVAEPTIVATVET
jgi:hypothetical protein